MSNPWEKPPENKKEETSSQKDHSNAIREVLEYKTGKKLPENKEELFRNFDELIPKEIDYVNVIDKVNPKDEHSSMYRYSREGMKSDLERELYETTMKEVKKFFEKELEQADDVLSKEQQRIDLGYKKTFDDKLGEKHAKASELFNQLNFGSLEIPLADIESRIYESHSIDDQENDMLRKFAERLSAEIYKNNQRNKVTTSDVKKTLQEIERFHASGDDKEYHDEHFGKVFEDFNKGNFDSVLKEIEFTIGWIQENLENKKNKDRGNISVDALKKRYGENFISAINKELEKLRSYRKFLKSGESKNV